MSSKVSVGGNLLGLWPGFTYFDHQEKGVHWMLEKELEGTEVLGRNMKNFSTVYGGLQCDDMGLGKTIQITGSIINNPLKKTLLVAPLAMIDTWCEVLIKAGLRVYTCETHSKIPWKGLHKVSGGIGGFFAVKPAVYITNYEKLTRASSLFSLEFDRIILDEAHRIRNGDGESAKAIRKIPARVRWAVTGTPLINSYKDVVSLLAFIGVPYSPLWTWEGRYDHMIHDLMIHRSLSEMRHAIPGAPPVPNIHNIFLPFQTDIEEDFYYGIQGTIESKLSRYTGDLINPQERLKLLIRLRQISVHPQCYINAKRREDPEYDRDDWDLPSTKLCGISDIIKKDTKDTDNHKYLIFCQFDDEINLIKTFLEKEECVDELYIYNGSMTQKQRTIVLEECKTSTKSCALLVNLMSGNAGLNLQFCDRVIFLSHWWAQATIDQALARSVRIGQQEVVQVYHLKLKAEEEHSINIDALIEGRAKMKAQMLKDLFVMCE